MELQFTNTARAEILQENLEKTILVFLQKIKNHYDFQGEKLIRIRFNVMNENAEQWITVNIVSHNRKAGFSSLTS